MGLLRAAGRTHYPARRATSWFGGSLAPAAPSFPGPPEGKLQISWQGFAEVPLLFISTSLGFGPPFHSLVEGFECVRDVGIPSPIPVHPQSLHTGEQILTL